MSMCRLTLAGCDDDTVIDLEMTAEQHEFVTGLAVKFNAESAYSCMPRLKVQRLTDGGAQ